MRRSVILTTLAALALLGAVAGAKAAPEDINGVWVTDDGQGAVEIAPCGGAVCGRIVWLKTPTMDGQPLRDARNPDSSARSRPICGLRVLGDLKPKGNRFEGGWIYDPETGSRYQLSAEMRRNGRLAVIGFVGVEALGETMEWTRAPAGLGRCS
ncbi:DUF2147 domain-containing protein [Ancylobacter oerskovii]|uniref:DUF2147 domain-containing protein n=1 Tax=Ancylobacter oerskovii TaxID=459519 RepID=A0ABW4YZB1_9HYPH|nr:DUF2147 domain-containing protein [Ancylobacter oerskovii]MBS7543938.1 DUF2147 domain-containing protein [Ancylobacter oerskovii]